MKKILFTLATVLCSYVCYGQTTHLGTETFTYNGNTVYHYGLGWYSDSDASAFGPMAYLSAYGGFKFFTAGSVKGAMDVYGNLGIGTTTPGAKLTARSGTNAFPATSGSTQSAGAFRVEGGDNAVIDFGANSINTWIQATDKSSLDYNYNLFLNPNGGNVGIGTTDTKGYKLAVNGAAIATSIKVKLYANWPDFVFKKDYKLPTLTAVKNYIDQNQRLPDMPSADEVHANGLDLGDMNRLLVKKVEELTLYLIDQSKQLIEQQKAIKSLQDQINKLIDKK